MVAKSCLDATLDIVGIKALIQSIARGAEDIKEMEREMHSLNSFIKPMDGWIRSIHAMASTPA